MTWKVVLDPHEVAAQRTELSLNDGQISIDQAGVDWGDAQITAFQTQEQRYGASVIGYRLPNRTIRIPLFLGVSGDQETARSQLQQKVARIQNEGGWLKRQRAAGDPLYADVVNATLTLPDVWGETGGVEPGVVLQLECLPDFYGDAIALDTMFGTGEFASVLQENGQQAVILGDAPARCHVTLIDQSGHDQFGLLWAFRSRWYQSAAPVIVPQSAMNPAAGAAWHSDSAFGSQSLQLALNAGQTAPLFSITGSHVGSYEVWARVYGPSDGSAVQFAWNIGDTSHGSITDGWIDLAVGGPPVFHGGDPRSPTGWNLINLGQIRIDPALIGTQQWAGTLSIRAAGAWTFACDRIYLQPLDEAAGQAVGVKANDPVLAANGTTELHWNRPVRSIGTSQVFTPISKLFGDLPRLPPSGMEQRPVELFAKPSRGDLSFASDSGDASSSDTFAVSVTYRPAYLFRP